jgi:alkylmercury lyase
VITDDVRGAAFRHLLRTAAPATPDQLADDLGQSPDQVRAALDTLRGQGVARLDATGRVIGAAGLSIRSDRHEIDLGGRRFWTWCAYDILGIFGALRATGKARSTTPDTGEPVEIHFTGGQPEPAPLVLFLPDEDYTACCTSAYDDWCPNSNLFHTAEAARSLAAGHGVTGDVLTLPEAAERGTARWRPLATGQPA